MYDGKWSFNLANPSLIVSDYDRGKTLDDIIHHFLNTADSSSIDNFIRYYEILDSDKLKEIVLSTEKENGVFYDVPKICKCFESRRSVITKTLRK